MKYLTIYRPYLLSELKKKAKRGNNGEAEAEDWDSALNNYTMKGYKIIKCGTFVSGEYAYFWAILEEPQSKTD